MILRSENTLLNHVKTLENPDFIRENKPLFP